VIQFRIEDKISDFFLSGEVVDGDTVLVDASDDGEILLKRIDTPLLEPQAPPA